MADNAVVDDSWCEGLGLYPEHDWVVIDERDGERALVCRRCDADIVEPIEEEDTQR